MASKTNNKNKVSKESKNLRIARDKGVSSTNLLNKMNDIKCIEPDKATRIKVEKLLNELASLCGSKGFDFYGAIFMAPGIFSDVFTQGGNDFSHQCTRLFHISSGLRELFRFPYTETSDIDLETVSLKWVLE